MSDKCEIISVFVSDFFILQIQLVCSFAFFGAVVLRHSGNVVERESRIDFFTVGRGGYFGNANVIGLRGKTRSYPRAVFVGIFYSYFCRFVIGIAQVFACRACRLRDTQNAARVISVYVVIGLIVHYVFTVDDILSYRFQLSVRDGIFAFVFVGQNKVYVLIYQSVFIGRTACDKALQSVTRNHTVAPGSIAVGFGAKLGELFGKGHFCFEERRIVVIVASRKRQCRASNERDSDYNAKNFEFFHNFLTF